MTQADNTPAPQPTSVQQDVRAGVLAALMPFGAGMLLTLGYAWIGVFGVVLAAIGAAGWAFRWHNKHQGWFPQQLTTGSVVGQTALVALITLLLFVSIS
ncbi:hypothetical protein EIL87_19610 [Saccharopolyspora rhizosphaerae]|uniref:Uncharacterized protein n=1 Tax=Saccharopolyspora rhizosphaerae TaxID=2492662 RepID=A0A426JP48_9PSEU|nr:hypothetical protein [Saccharopolyspora rhizosphaerae]RRO14924.1 hypothetical protein EIL87_19610 [Saccharopolyspora rhizosphaerae]